jgi:hypothetical protein
MSFNKKTVKYGKISNVVVMIFPDDQEAGKYIDHIKNATLSRALQGLKIREQDFTDIKKKPLIPNPLRPRQVA